MGAVIEGVHACRGRRWPRRDGSVSLASRAARAALRQADRPPGDVDLLINAGVYRDDNILEPAMAPFIQRNIGANPRAPGEARPRRSTFSFDLNNGGCGFVNAIQTVDGFLRSGRIRHGLVVTSDVDPEPRVSRGLRFETAGAALALARGAPDEGFAGFHSESFTKHARLFRSGLGWDTQGSPRWAKGAPHALVAREDPDYLAECVNCAELATERFLGRLGMTLDQLDLVVPSQHPARFPRAFQVSVGMEASHVVDVTREFGVTHTSGLAAAVQAAMARGLWARARTILFVSVGAGISVALALYARGMRDVAPLP